MQALPLPKLSPLANAASAFDELNPSPRLLMGPGPINADPRVLKAMSTQLLGQFDPQFRRMMRETMALYRAFFETQNDWTLVLDGTARSAIEMVMLSAIEPGDKVLVCSFGRFGQLLHEIAVRCGAEVRVAQARMGHGARSGADRGRAEGLLAQARRRVPGRHLDHDAAAAGRTGRALPPLRRDAAGRRHGLLRRHTVAGGCLAGRCRHGGPAEMPGGAVGRGADHVVGGDGENDLPPPPCRRGPAPGRTTCRGRVSASPRTTWTWRW